MNPRRTASINRLVVVGTATVLWIAIIKWLVPSFLMGHAILLAVWIAAGSNHYARSLSDFERPLTVKSLTGLTLLAPGWPFLYWTMRRNSMARAKED